MGLDELRLRYEKLLGGNVEEKLTQLFDPHGLTDERAVALLECLETLDPADWPDKVKALTERRTPQPTCDKNARRRYPHF